MNLLKGQVSLNGSASVRMSNGVELPLGETTASDGQAVVYGIRPEHLAIAADGLPAEVAVVEPTGSETQVVARLGGQEVIVLLRERIAVQPGETIRLKPDMRFVHLFDATTGQRVS